jgi:hypothetical protein
MSPYADRVEIDFPEPAVDRRTVRQQVADTTHAVNAADGAHVRNAAGSVQWERRGLLQRLSRS